MIKNMQLLSLTLCVIGSSIFVSCNNESKKENVSDSIDSTNIEELKEDISTFNYILPSPLQIASLYHHIGLKFNEKLTNPISNKSKYNSEFAKTINIGVYSADLAFAILSNENQFALNGLKTIKELSDEIGMGSIYQNGDVLTKIKNNVDNIDSLTELFSNIEVDSKTYLEENEKKNSSLTIFAGGFVESIYIATQSTQKINSEKLISRLSEQIITLNNLVHLLKDEKKTSQNEKHLIELMVQLQNVYMNCADYKAKMAVAEEGEDVSSFSISDEELKKIRDEFAKVRNEITVNN